MNVWSFSKNGEFTIALWIFFVGENHDAPSGWNGFQLCFEERLILKNQTLVVYHNHKKATKWKPNNQTCLLESKVHHKKWRVSSNNNRDLTNKTVVSSLSATKRRIHRHIWKWRSNQHFGLICSLFPSTDPFTLWLFNIAMENCPFIDDLPIKNGDFPWLC